MSVDVYIWQLNREQQHSAADILVLKRLQQPVFKQSFKLKDKQKLIFFLIQNLGNWLNRASKSTILNTYTYIFF